MGFSFSSFNFLFLSSVFAIFMAEGSKAVSNEIQSLQKELEEVILATETLNKGKEVLIKEINSSENSCNETVVKLKEARFSLVISLLKENKTVGLLMQRLVEEDEVHMKLESKLKELYADLEVSGVIYETKYQELFLLENRRHNGTDLRCETIIKRLENPKINTNKTVLQTRSLSSWLTKFKGKQTKEITLQNKISIAKVVESQVKSDYQALTLKKESNDQLCILKKSNLNKQIAFIKEVLRSFKDSIEVLNTNIHTSIFLTQSLSVEIQLGEKLLSTIKQNTFKFINVKESFKKDEQCYGSVKKTI